MGLAPLFTGAFSEIIISPVIGEETAISGAPGERAVVADPETLTLEEVAEPELPQSDVATTLNVYVPAGRFAIVQVVVVVEHD